MAERKSTGIAGRIQAALIRAGLEDGQIETMLEAIGLDPAAPAEKPDKAKTVSTEAKVENARPGIYRVEGSRRLYLKKTSRKTGSYFLRYRTEGMTTGGKPRRPHMGLGSIKHVSLARARELAEEIGVSLTRKLNPLAERDRMAKAAAEAAAREAAVLTVTEGVEAYLEATAKAWKHVYAVRTWFNPIERYAYPVIGKLKIDEVESRHILAIVAACDAKGLTIMGRKVRSRLKTVFDYLAAHGLRNATLPNPADAGVINAGNRDRGRAKTTHYRRIDLDQAPGVFRQLHDLAGENTAIACWCFMALTAARPGEALAARFDQIDLKKKLWVNPMSKTETPLTVPLSDLALEIVKRQEANRKSNLVFANANGGRMAHSSFATAPRRAKIEAGAPHSWRSILRDAAEDELRFRRETAEAALGHSLGAVELAYRRETGVEERAKLMNAYAGWLTNDSAGNVVVAFEKRA